MKILIVEDEARIAKRLERMAVAYFGLPELKIAVVDSLMRGIAYLDNHEIDVLLLDLNLNGEDGFNVLGSIVARSFQTIVVSANTDRAIDAFGYGVIDFVPKPFDETRLAQAFDRLGSVQISNQHRLKFLAVKKTGTVKLIPINEVCFIKGAGIYSEIHLLNGKTELHDKSLESLQQLLHGQFERIHKSYLVQLEQAVKIEIQTGSRYLLILKNGEVLPIGRSKYGGLKESLA